MIRKNWLATLLIHLAQAFAASSSQRKFWRLVLYGPHCGAQAGAPPLRFIATKNIAVDP
jgi:hypothetical protein